MLHRTIKKHAENSSQEITDEFMERIFNQLGVDSDTVVIELVDIDDTATSMCIPVFSRAGYLHLQPAKHFISPVLLASMDRNQRIAKKLGATYAGFCIETHRGINFEFQIDRHGKETGSAGIAIYSVKINSFFCQQSEDDSFIVEEAKHVISQYKDVNPDDFLTPNVAVNLSTLTGTPCLGIGTLDDRIGNRKFGEGHEACKQWYKDLLASKQVDETKKIPQYKVPLLTEYKFCEHPDNTTKNDMHERAQEAMRQKFPSKKILFIFNDDNERICAETLSTKLSAEVAIVVLKHNAFDQKQPVFRGYISTFTPKRELTSATLSLFASPSLVPESKAENILSLIDNEDDPNPNPHPNRV